MDEEIEYATYIKNTSVFLENVSEDVKMPWVFPLLKGLFLTSLVLTTIIGNVLVCLSVILVRKLRKPQNYLLVSLAVSDLFVALIVMPFAMVFELNQATWPLSNGLCDLWVSGEY